MRTKHVIALVLFLLGFAGHAIAHALFTEDAVCVVQAPMMAEDRLIVDHSSARGLLQTRIVLRDGPAEVLSEEGRPKGDKGEGDEKGGKGKGQKGKGKDEESAVDGKEGKDKDKESKGKGKGGKGQGKEDKGEGKGSKGNDKEEGKGEGKDKDGKGKDKDDKGEGKEGKSKGKEGKGEGKGKDKEDKGNDEEDKGKGKEGKGKGKEGKGDSEGKDKEGKGKDKEGKGEDKGDKGEGKEGKSKGKEGKGEGKGKDKEDKGNDEEDKGKGKEGKGKDKEGKGKDKEGKDKEGKGKGKGGKGKDEDSPAASPAPSGPTGEPDYCEGQVQMDMDRVVLTNNLGGLGPTAGDPVIHIQKFVDLMDGTTVDLLVSNLTEYGSNNPAINGLNGEFNNVNIKAGFVDLKFTFIDTVSKEPVLMPPFNMTVYDLDGPSKDVYAETVVFDDADFTSYKLSGSTAVIMTKTGSKTEFGSSAMGEACDNPSSIATVGVVVCEKSGTVDQKDRAVAVQMKGGKSEYHITLRASDAVKSGRNFLFGTPAYFDKVCHSPTLSPTLAPTLSPSSSPTASPTGSPSYSPTMSPSSSPTSSSTGSPSSSPTMSPSSSPTMSPSSSPTSFPTESPSPSPTTSPSSSPTSSPTGSPSSSPTMSPSSSPTTSPSSSPTSFPTGSPSSSPTMSPSSSPTLSPSYSPTSSPTVSRQSPKALPHNVATSFGDPHVTNLKGERFDILQTDYHTFLVIPRGADEEHALLHVVAKVDPLGQLCSGLLYVTSLRFSGHWVGDLSSLEFTTNVHATMEGEKAMKIKAGLSSDLNASQFREAVPQSLAEVTEFQPQEPQSLNQHVDLLLVKLKLGPSIAKVRMVYQKEKVGFSNSLWLTTTGLGRVHEEIGGILGLDDHTFASSKPKKCVEPDQGAASTLLGLPTPRGSVHASAFFEDVDA